LYALKNTYELIILIYHGTLSKLWFNNIFKPREYVSWVWLFRVAIPIRATLCFHDRFWYVYSWTYFIFLMLFLLSSHIKNAKKLLFILSKRSSKNWIYFIAWLSFFFQVNPDKNYKFLAFKHNELEVDWMACCTPFDESSISNQY